MQSSAHGPARERATWCALALLTLTALAGCYASHGRSGADGGGRDGTLGDGDEDTAIDEDGGWMEIEAGRFDAGPFDGGRRDAGLFDGGVSLDAGPRSDSGLGTDAGRHDAGPRVDAWSFDGGPPDGGAFDGGAHDAGRDGGLRSIALRFYGAQQVTIPDRPGLSVGPDTTYEMWIRARGPGILSRKGFDDGVQHHAIRLEHTPDGTMQIAAGWTVGGGGRREVRAPFDSHLGRWTHVALVIQSAERALQIRLYIDFAEAARAEVPDDLAAAYSLEPLALGRFDGDLDEVRLWFAVRDADTLRAHAFSRLRSGTTGLVAYWPIEEAPSQFVLDRSLRGNDGILGSTTMGDALDPMWITDGAIP